MPILETHSTQLLKVLERRHGRHQRFFAPDSQFCHGYELAALADSAKRQWPKVRFKEKRAIRLEEHRRHRKGDEPGTPGLLRVLLALGRGQSDMASLTAEDVDWQTKP